MSSVIGLAIGESFAEAVGLDTFNQRLFFKQRWYLPRKSLGEGLKDALRASPQEGGRLFVASDSMSRILDKSQGRSPAVLVTAGFETWLTLTQPLITPAFAVHGKRRLLPLEDDFVFAVSGRISADGSVVAEQPIEELEFLAAKLEMLKVKDVAITFMHAFVNPVHELQVANYLREKNIRVSCSHQNVGADQEERWRRTIENAFAASAILEEKEQIEMALKDAWASDATASSVSSSSNWTCEFWSERGLRPWAEYSPVAARGGLKSALGKISSSNPQALHFHCSLDRFQALEASVETAAAAFSISPTSLIRHGVWPFPSIAPEASGFAPGPMLFGKSQQLAMIDILYVLGHLAEIDSLTPLINEKSKSRILESLFTLAKSPVTSNAPKTRPPDPMRIALDLEYAFIERCAMVLAAAAVDGKQSVVLSGAFAETMMPLLKARRPDLKFSYALQGPDKKASDSGWIDGFAVAGGEMGMK